MYVFSRTSKYICSACRTKISMEDLEYVFRQELKAFFFPAERVNEHLAVADTELTEKRGRLAAHEKQLEKLRAEMRKTYLLYQQDQISPEGFGLVYKPLETQERQLAIELPKLQGELDALEIKRISAEEVSNEAWNLYTLWPEFAPEKKRSIIESIIESMVLNNSVIEVTFSYLSSSEEFTTKQRNLSGSLRRRA
jgi:hypothetical protein